MEFVQLRLRRARPSTAKKHRGGRPRLESSPLGKRLRELREWSGLAIVDAAELIGCTKSNLIEVEAGRRLPSARMLALYARAYDCEVAELERLAAQHERPCADDCDHDGEMRPGGTAEERFDDCAHYDGCLSKAVKKYPSARSVHCPPACPMRTTAPNYIRICLDGGQNGDQRWDTAEPFDKERQEQEP